MAPSEPIATRALTVGAAAGRFPTAIVASSWTGDPLPLGLEQPLELRGGAVLAPGRMPAELALDWVPAVQEAVIAACMRQALAAEPWFTMPPSALVGEPGAGRTLMARRIARCAGLPFLAIDVSGPAAASRLAPARRSPDVVAPSTVVLAMAVSRCANPVVLVTGVDEADEHALGILRSMIDPVSGRRWSADALEAVVDLGYVTWLVQSSSSLGLPRQLSKLRLLPVDSEVEHHAGLMGLSAASEVLDDLGIDSSTIDGRAMRDSMSGDAVDGAADLRLAAERALAGQLRGSR